MSGYVEQLDADEWLRSVLTGDAGLEALVGDQIFRSNVPQPDAVPAVVYSLSVPSQDTRVTSGPRIMTRLEYNVAGIVQTGSGNLVVLRAIAAAVDGILDRASGSTAAIRVDRCVRIQAFAPPDLVENGVTYHRIGGFYQLTVQPL